MRGSESAVSVETLRPVGSRAPKGTACPGCSEHPVGPPGTTGAAASAWSPPSWGRCSSWRAIFASVADAVRRRRVGACRPCRIVCSHRGPVHWLGTDDLGRDVLARLLFGARTSLVVAVGVVALSVLIGVVVGAVSGYFGRWIDEVLMRITDAFLAFPPLLLAVLVAAALGASLRNTLIAISVSWWPWYARQVRAQVLSLRARPFIRAVQAIGVPSRRVIAVHVVPNVMAPVWVQATADLGAVVLTAAGLSFVGLGPRPPTADWGVMIADGRQYVLSGQWWIAGFAGLAVVVVALAFNLIGDVVRDVTDPRTRGEYR